VIYERASGREATLAGFGKNMFSGPRVSQTRKELRQSSLDSRKIFSAVYN
jgi:hypothetical protein